jgi:hypothetical protein
VQNCGSKNYQYVNKTLERTDNLVVSNRLDLVSDCSDCDQSRGTMVHIATPKVRNLCWLGTVLMFGALPCLHKYLRVNFPGWNLTQNIHTFTPRP